ncbi:MAG: adenylyl-sulfate kinase [Syntrophobacteraceae bacterium]
MESGAILYWLTGLSGSGKSVLGYRLYERLRERQSNLVYLDGDNLREVFGGTAGHTTGERRQLALTYCRFCRMLVEQGISVVIATMSLFHEVHEYNRQNIPNYIEVFIECHIDELIRRDQKGIYSSALRGNLRDVIGIDLPYDRPVQSDLTIDNTEPNHLEEKVDRIMQLARERKLYLYD